MKDLVIIYSNDNQECERAVSFIESLNKDYLVYKLNQHFSQRSFDQEFGKKAEYPQIAIGYKHVGGLKETLNHMRETGQFGNT